MVEEYEKEVEQKKKQSEIMFEALKNSLEIAMRRY